jgi:DNA-binding winged helix-turn-helix (wHTH) protein
LGPPGEIDYGGLTLRTRDRVLVGPTASVAMEPLVARLLIALSRRAGHMVARSELFQLCWGDTPVGDDSLNRVVAGLRRALRDVGDGSVVIETIPAAGYTLRLPPDGVASHQVREELACAARAALKSWRAAYPEPDALTTERLRRALALVPDAANGWGMLALMHRHAAEYGDVAERADQVAACHDAAHRALDIDPGQIEAQVALISIIPLFGNWGEAHEQLSALCDADPNNAVAAHDLAIIEMATGRVRAAKSIIARLIAGDRLAPIYGYKATYQNWSTGDLAEMDRVADNSIQLWPSHPAVWTARFWSLAYTKRVAAALAMLDDAAPSPPIDRIGRSNLSTLLRAFEERNRAQLERLGEKATQAAAAGPIQAITSLFTVGLIGDLERAKSITKAYYLHEGKEPVPQSVTAEPGLNEARRRVTQILFTPAGSMLRQDRAFDELCDRIGLSRYWSNSGRWPDYLAQDRATTLR